MKRATRIYKKLLLLRKISIHALVKRATSVNHHLSIPCNYFNPRPREEGDVGDKVKKGAKLDFNPRPREEGDRSITTCPYRAIISIHALVKRATKDEFISADYKTNFNPRPREEGDWTGLYLYR